MSRQRSQYLLQMAPCADLVANIMLGHAHHTLAEQPIGRFRTIHRQIMQLLRKWQRTTVSTCRGVVVVQAPESPQLVFDIAKALRDFQYLGERHAHLWNLERWSTQRGEQPHALARVQGPSGSKNAKRLLGAAVALLKQR